MHGKCLFAAVCVLLTAALAGAQETTTGSIAGRVVDAQGLAVPGATVTVTTPQGPRTFITDSSGAFFAPFLTPGQYEVKVELQGFHTLDRPNIEVRLGQRVELTFPLQVGALTESVTVTSTAPVVDTSSTTTGAILDSDSDHAKQLQSDFVVTLRDLLNGSKHRHRFTFIEFPQSIAKRVTDQEQAFWLSRKANVHFLIYGRARLRAMPQGKTGFDGALQTCIASG